MWKRNLCLVMSMFLLWGTVGVTHVYAEDLPTETTNVISFDSKIETLEETLIVNETPEIINVTSGSVWLEVGKKYRFIHDTIEIVSIYSFDTLITVKADLSIVANESGTTNLMLVYYNSDNVLSTLSCQVEIIEISGVIDFAKDKVFVEKGKNYRWIHSELTPQSFSLMNSEIITMTHGGDVITAVDAGTANIAYVYQQDDSLVPSFCTFDVYEAFDVSSHQINSTDNFYIAIKSGRPLVITYEEDGSSQYPALYGADYSNYSNQEFCISQTEDGYYYIYSPYQDVYLGIDSAVPSLDSDLIFASSMITDGTQIFKWKLLKHHNERNSFLLIPKGAESEQVVMSCTRHSIGHKNVLCSYTDDDDDVFMLYNSNIYVNQYYDASLCDDTGTDIMSINAIIAAGGFVNTAFSNYYGSMRINMKGFPIQAIDSPTNQCPIGVNGACDDDLCGLSHPHKNTNEIFDFMRDDLPRMNNEITVLWSDRTDGSFCKHTGQTCVPYDGVVGINPNNSDTAMLVLIMTTREVILANYGDSITQNDLSNYLSVALAHEITHVLGMGENYYRESHKLEGDEFFSDSISCVMEAAVAPHLMREFCAEVRAGNIEPLCDDCYDDWQGNMNSAFFRGNAS